MAIYDNGLEEIFPSSTAWLDILNANFEQCLTSNADAEFSSADIGPVLTDRNGSGDQYRLYISGGTLTLEAI